MTIEERGVIYFFYLRDTPNEDILARLERRYGEDIDNLKQCTIGPRNIATGKQSLTMNRGQGDHDETKNDR
jgi:hypothetical protein